MERFVLRKRVWVGCFGLALSHGQSGCPGDGIKHERVKVI